MGDGYIARRRSRFGCTAGWGRGAGHLVREIPPLRARCKGTSEILRCSLRHQWTMSVRTWGSRLRTHFGSIGGLRFGRLGSTGGRSISRRTFRAFGTSGRPTRRNIPIRSASTGIRWPNYKRCSSLAWSGRLPSSQLGCRCRSTSLRRPIIWKPIRYAWRCVRCRRMCPQASQGPWDGST